MLKGFIMGLIGVIISSIRNAITLKKCLIDDTNSDVDFFEHKGKKYDKNKYIEIRTEYLEYNGFTKKRELEKNIKKTKKDRDKDKGKYKEIYSVEIEVYETLLKKYHPDSDLLPKQENSVISHDTDNIEIAETTIIEPVTYEPETSETLPSDTVSEAEPVKSKNPIANETNQKENIQGLSELEKTAISPQRKFNPAIIVLCVVVVLLLVAFTFVFSQNLTYKSIVTESNSQTTINIDNTENHNTTTESDNAQREKIESIGSASDTRKQLQNDYALANDYKELIDSQIKNNSYVNSDLYAEYETVVTKLYNSKSDFEQYFPDESEEYINTIDEMHSKLNEYSEKVKDN